MTTAQQELIEYLATRRDRQPEATDYRPWVFGGLAVAIVAGLLWLQPKLTTAAAPARNYYYAEYTQAQEFVRAALKSPASASFPWADYKVADLGGGKLMVISHVDAQNGFGANIRTRWAVVMQNGKLLSLNWE